MAVDSKNQSGDPLSKANGRHSDTEARPIALLLHARDCLHYALQPIVNIHTGAVFGFEALLRGVGELGFADVEALFSFALEADQGGALERDLRALAVAQFARLPEAARYRLFLNLDPRLIRLDQPEETCALLDRYGLSPRSVCFELHEHANPSLRNEIGSRLADYRHYGFQLAIDDFGGGFAGLRLLYEHPADLLKIDRFFIEGIATDHRKRLFLANIVQLAHIMGVVVIAEGVETQEELITCREVGCDLAQGFLIESPQQVIETLRGAYDQVARINEQNRREKTGDRSLIEAGMVKIPPLHEYDGIKSMFEAFRLDEGYHVVPVLDEGDRPLGVILESDIKEFIYSVYGRDLIVNRAYARTLNDFVRTCPTVDIHDSAERLIEAYSANVNPAGLLVTRDGRYLGFISAMSLVQLIEQKNLTIARDQNPLTKLPGNNPIHEYVSRVLNERHGIWHLVYFDFDHFKAFNDHYGFRRGDRAILMFAELLRKDLLDRGSWFVGHIGGDDFFAGTLNMQSPVVIDQLSLLLDRFRVDAQSLYDAEDRQRGFIRASDRYGNERDIPLIRCSAALLEIHPTHRISAVEDLGRVIAEIKHQAKADAGGLITRRFPLDTPGAPDPKGHLNPACGSAIGNERVEYSVS